LSTEGSSLPRTDENKDPKWAAKKGYAYQKLIYTEKKKGADRGPQKVGKSGIFWGEKKEYMQERKGNIYPQRGRGRFKAKREIVRGDGFARKKVPFSPGV